MFQRLVLGCGRFHPRKEGDVNLDIQPFENVDVVHDLNKPYPFEDNTFDAILSLHIVEHLKDMIHYMDECWRVLKEGGEMYLETPLAGANTELEFADPTHVRCYTTYTFHNYFTLTGIHNFGYTDKPWAIISCYTKQSQPHLSSPPDVLVFHGYPIKKKIILLDEQGEFNA